MDLNILSLLLAIVTSVEMITRHVATPSSLRPSKLTEPSLTVQIMVLSG